MRVAAFTGLGGNFVPESVAASDRIGWQNSPEYAIDLFANTLLFNEARKT
jgi:hypothetical protein